MSPSYTDLGDDLEKQSGYFDNPWSWENIKANQEKIALFYSDNDPFIPQSEFEYIADKLMPSNVKTHGSGHFIDRQDFPEILQFIKQTYS